MTLREKLIEAGARAMERIANADEAEEVTWLEMVEVGLDAMLDCLTENADEWAIQTWIGTTTRERVVAVHKLLAVLREDR